MVWLFISVLRSQLVYFMPYICPWLFSFTAIAATSSTKQPKVLSATNRNQLLLIFRRPVTSVERTKRFPTKSFFVFVRGSGWLNTQLLCFLYSQATWIRWFCRWSLKLKDNDLKVWRPCNSTCTGSEFPTTKPSEIRASKNWPTFRVCNQFTL